MYQDSCWDGQLSGYSHGSLVYKVYQDSCWDGQLSGYSHGSLVPGVPRQLLGWAAAGVQPWFVGTRCTKTAAGMGSCRGTAVVRWYQVYQDSCWDGQLPGYSRGSLVPGVPRQLLGWAAAGVHAVTLHDTQSMETRTDCADLRPRLSRNNREQSGSLDKVRFVSYTRCEWWSLFETDLALYGTHLDVMTVMK